MLWIRTTRATKGVSARRKEYPKQGGRAALRFSPKGGTDRKTIVDLKGPESASFVKAIGKTQLSSAPALSATDFFFIIVSAGMLRRWKLPGYHMNFFCHLIPTRREDPRACGEIRAIFYLTVGSERNSMNSSRGTEVQNRCANNMVSYVYKIWTKFFTYCILCTYFIYW